MTQHNTGYTEEHGGLQNDFEEEWIEDFIKEYSVNLVDIKLPKELARRKLNQILSSRDTYWKERVRKEVEGKDGAYHERDMLVCALSKLFPSYLARHSEEDTEWENDWRWIVYINIPTGKMLLPTGNEIQRHEQISWHIHDSEREMFNHLEVKENNWDGHNTERKYQRLQALDTLLDNLK